MTKIPFIKMNGAGNDFVIIDARKDSPILDKDTIISLASRSNKDSGGCDQLLILKNSDAADVFMQIYNTDGSEAKACGNATRCVAWLIFGEKPDASQVSVQTIERILTCKIRSGLESLFAGEDAIIEADMGKAVAIASEGDLISIGREAGIAQVKAALRVDVGNPHVIFFVGEQDLNDSVFRKAGAFLQTHKLFPGGVNVTIASVADRKTLDTNVWERGVGITQACGTAACASGFAAIELGYCDPETDIKINIGSGKNARILLVNGTKNGNITLIGPVKLDFYFE
ncbi:MAG: diaminopimelate epimerase [Pseudomonadota bacterium]